MIRFSLSFLVAMSMFLSGLNAQVTLDPFFATANDIVTVTYDASQGNGALVGQSQIYGHCGVITNLSTGPSDWKYVQGAWGTADPNTAMTNQGGDIHTLTIDIPNFYNVPAGEEIIELAFVFRTANGSIVGRTASGGDIYAPIYSGFGAVLLNPAEDFFFIQSNQTINVSALASETSNLTIFIDDSLVLQNPAATSLTYTLNTADFSPSKHYVSMRAIANGDTIVDSSSYIFQTPPTIAALPVGINDGANYINDTTVILKLTAPFKPFSYVIGDFNNWEFDDAYSMNITPDSSAFWIEISGLNAGQEYRYQYVVDHDLIRIADPYANKILDPWNDQYIPTTTYPDLISYPVGKTNEPVSVLQTAMPEYVWDTTINFTKPAKGDLRVYELLIRDFTTERTFQAVIDSLDYFSRLGINAIEFMPVNEFEGNESWGYNPSFHFALDKYYGTPDKFKELVEEAHKKGIAIIIDMVLNHQFGQSPMVRMYFDGATYKPTADNPWFLEDAAHDFNVGYDFDHESPWTRKFVDDVMRYWVEEFHVDGYRMDLSKGFTSKNTLGNIGLFGQYDSSRVFNLTRMADEVWNYDSTTIIILEHFADNSEEKVLSNTGFMLWGNHNYDYRNLSKGGAANVSWSSYKSRGWDNPYLVSYMESHDEERMMYTNTLEGATLPSYNIKEPHVGLKRAELCAVYFLSTPGPKMIWQFGELGYDLSINRCEDGSINNNCRLSNKPPRWEYLENSDHKRLFEVYAAMNHLREEYPAFASSDFSMDAQYGVKTIKISDPSMSVFTICNFNTVDANPEKSLPGNGVWYEYFTGDSITVTNNTYSFELEKGEYRLYTTNKLTKPEITAGLNDVISEETDFLVYPNPGTEVMNIVLPFALNSSNDITVYDLNGKRVSAKISGSESNFQLNVSDLNAGLYLILVSHEGTLMKQLVSVQ
jgi:glycosidase